MAYDEKLAARIREVLEGRPDVTEKKMFGGVAFLVDGKMFAGLAGKDLMVRVGPEAYEAALGEKHVRPMDFTGRPLTGYVYVAPTALKTDAALADWVGRGLRFTAALPAKKKKPARKRPPTFPRDRARRR